MTESTERLFLRFMWVMLRGLVTLANANLSAAQTREIIDLKQDLAKAAFPSGLPERYR